MRTRVLAILSLLLSIQPAFADRYEFDKPHTNIMFYIDHAGFSKMIGLFTRYDGSFEFDLHHPEQSKIDVTLYPAGIRTSSEALDKTLQGSDFFNSEQFPKIRFVSTVVKITGEQSGDITGNITLLGVTKTVTLHVKFNKADYHPITRDFIAGFSADATFKRSEFGMSHLIPMVGDEVRIEIETEGVNQDRKKAERIKH